MRRILVGSIAVSAALTVAITAGAQTPTGVAPALTISHWQVTVSDLKKSQEFYARLLGATVIDTSPTTWTLKIPTASQWLSITKAQGTDPSTGLSSKPGMFELGIGIDLTPKNAEQVRTALRQAFPDAKVVSPGKRGDPAYDRVIVVDRPDDIRFRLVSSKDDGHLPKHDKTPAVARTPTKGVVTMRNLNHINVTARDVNTSVEFYSRLLGAPVREKTANGRGATLSVAGPFWLRFGTARDPSKVVGFRQPNPEGIIDHPGLGIDITPATAPAIRTALMEAFPGVRVYSPGTPAQEIFNRSVYIVDPDGLLYQLISSTDDGHTSGA